MTPAATCPYMAEPWFALLAAHCASKRHYEVAAQLGISTTALSMVLRGHGPYGTGAAGTARIAQRVQHAFGTRECPHLTRESEGAQPVFIDAARCRRIAHRAPPTQSPRDMQHWRACRQCPHFQPATSPTKEVTP